MRSIFDHTFPEIPKNCVYNISPSSIGKFFTDRFEWYEQYYLKKKKELPTPAMLTGTLCHYYYEQVTLTGEKPSPITIIQNLLDFVRLNKYDYEVNIENIMSNYSQVTECVYSEYLSKSNSLPIEIKTESNVIAEIKDGIYILGICDRIEGDCLVEFKTVGMIKEDMPVQYFMQLMSYVYTLEKLGHKINRIRIVYGIKPSRKDPLPHCVVVTKKISEKDKRATEKLLLFLVDTILEIRNNPEYAHLILSLKRIPEKLC